MNKHHLFLRALSIVLFGLFCHNLVAADWSPAGTEIKSRWAAEVSLKSVLPEYPRPQMVRTVWQSLNGLWDYAIVDKDAAQPGSFQGRILVPFPIQSSLSGVMKPITPEQTLWYRRTFKVPAAWKGKRVLLHFGAADWRSAVWLNGKRLGQHEGGYDAFSFDITSALNPTGSQELIVSVWDPNDAGAIPRGKQLLKPAGTKYTAVTGIWQTPWLEPVPGAHVSSIKITPDVDHSEARFAVDVVGSQASDRVKVEVREKGRVVATIDGKPGEEISVKLKRPKLWEPGHPFLYDVKVTLLDSGRAIDSASSYFGMRKVEIKKDVAGVNRIFLNDKPLFEFGLLDQGWWPDGLYTAPTDAALKFDIEETLKMGFNLARKHVKVETERWYYWADKLGLLVWQDMPNGERPWRGPEPATPRKLPAKPFDKLLADQTYAIYEREYKALIEGRYNHPSIIMWVPFNEGWGEFDAPRIAAWTKQLDPTRLVNDASGWYDMNAGDVSDVHKYPGPTMAKLEADRASVLGEFGGLGLAITGHLWGTERRWGYRNMETVPDLTKHYASVINALKAYEARGLAAAVYTQTTDCEGEVNGFLTYDRAVNKMGAATVAKINRSVYGIKTDLHATIPEVDMPPPPPRPKALAN